MKPFTLLAIAVFVLMALMHVLRLFLGWDVSFNGMLVPLWASVLGFLIAGGLAFGLWRERS
ncbi:MAG: hypothetical protein ABI475_04520 [Methylophilaceae bacterium]